MASTISRLLMFTIANWIIIGTLLFLSITYAPNGLFELLYFSKLSRFNISSEPPTASSPSGYTWAAIPAKRRCKYPLVYNKPPKTASTYIQNAIVKWATPRKRHVFMCGSRPMESAIRLQECVPYNRDGCGILNCHLYLDHTVTTMLRERLPNYRLISSTRNPAHRIISHFLQEKLLQNNGTTDLSSEFRKFLQNEYNPSEILSWHRGYHERKRCPMSMTDRLQLYNDVAKYFIVIDANLRIESNTILRYKKLFMLPKVKERYNERNTVAFKLSPDLKELLFNVSCYERAIHSALQLRMASLYEKASRKKCVFRGRLDNFTSCLAEREKKHLGDSWLF